MTRSLTLLATPLFLLAACGGSSSGGAGVLVAPEFGAANVNNDGSIDTILINKLTGSEVNANGVGFGYVVGGYPDVLGAGGFSGLTDATNLTGALPSGTASMQGVYRVGEIDDMAIQDGVVTGTTTQAGGLITLTADFDNATLTGNHNDLTVNGTFFGNALDGTVTFNGLSGDLEGQINGTRAVGAFAGGDADTVYAGGFLVDE